MIETLPTNFPKVVGLRLSGRLHDEDFKRFEPSIETILTTDGKVRLFIQFDDFHGWDLHAALDDLKFSMRHYSDFERIAIVGDRRWERWMATFCKPFTHARVKYFDKSEIDAAWTWLRDTDEYSGAEEDRTAEMPTEASGANPWVWYGL